MSPSVASPEEKKKWIALGVLSPYAWSTVDTSLCVSPVAPGRNSHISHVEVDLGSRGPGFFLRFAWFDSGYIFCVSLGALELFHQFLREGRTRILKSSLSCSPEQLAALVVGNGSGMCIAGFGLYCYTSLCSLRLSVGLRYGEVHTVDASFLAFHVEIWTSFL